MAKTADKETSMIVRYSGRAHDDLARYTGIRKAADSSRSWFAELWFRGRYIGIAR